MYRIRLIIERIPEALAVEAARDITDGFKSRPWHASAVCTWRGSALVLDVENDFDENGLATMDEFAHEFANVPIFEGDDGNLRIDSIVEV